ncbi:MAG: ABC transporter permease [Spirosomataceae bacterium]
MLAAYLKIARGNLTKNKVSSAIHIAGLTIGITSCLIIFLIADFELNHDTFHADGDRIYRIVCHRQSLGRESDMGYVPSPLPVQLKQYINGLDDAAGFYNYYAKVSISASGGKTTDFPMPSRESASPIVVAQPDYFSIFQYNWLVGNKTTALSEPHKVVITDREARKYFGDAPLEHLPGREIIFNDSLHLTVSGIVQAWDNYSDFNFSHFISFATVEHSFLKNDIDLNNWGTWDFYSQAFVKLSEKSSPEQIEAQFPLLIKDRFRLDETMKVQLKLQPLHDIHFNAAYSDAYARKVSRSTLYGLMVIAAFILLMAAVNYINLSTAQAVQRAKEAGVRKVLGSTHRGLIYQFLGETALLTLIAVLLSVFLVFPVLSLFRSFLPVGLGLSPFRLSVWVFFGGIFLLTSLSAGFYPAKIVAATLPAESLKGGYTSGTQKSYFRKGLIVFQFSISLIFMMATLVVGKQIRYLLNKELGFAKEAILTVKLPAEQNELATKKHFTEQLRQLPAISGVSLHRDTPLASRHGSTTIKRIGVAVPEISAAFEFTDEHYLSLYEIKLLAGRSLSLADTIKEFVINAFCAKALGFRTPAEAIGQPVQVGIAGKTGAIVGVVHDFHAQSLHETIQPFFMTTQAGAFRTVSLRLAPTDKADPNIAKTVDDVHRIYRALYPDAAFDYRFFDDTVASFYEEEQKTARLINVAMIIAIFISCIGLYGMSAFIAQQRTKEIGIRKVLGASVAQITVLLSQDFIWLTGIALVIASPIAGYFLTEWLMNYPYRTELNGWIFAAAGLITAVITLLTVSYQSIRMALMNPVESLRTE